MVIQPIGGLLSDRLGRKPLLVFGIGGVLYTYVLLTYPPRTTSPLSFADRRRLRHPHRLHSVNAIVKAELFSRRNPRPSVGLLGPWRTRPSAAPRPAVPGTEVRITCGWFIAYVTSQ